jgi:molybdopterin-guanine dinucleotide biosynthesis protein A
MTVDGAIVLAGGKSTRMGQDKALLPWNGTTLLAHCVSSLRTLTSEIVVVADRADRYTLPGCRMAADLFPDAGPVGGIVTGLTALGEGRHIAVACDMPYLQPALLNLLLDAATEAWDAIVPEVAGRPEPLCAVYRHTAAPALRRFLEEGQRAAYRALQILRTRRIPEDDLRRADPDLRSFINLNTPADLDRILGC